jgi:hypothetical protein
MAGSAINWYKVSSGGSLKGHVYISRATIASVMGLAPGADVSAFVQSLHADGALAEETVRILSKQSESPGGMAKSAETSKDAQTASKGVMPASFDAYPGVWEFVKDDPAALAFAQQMVDAIAVYTKPDLYAKASPIGVNSEADQVMRDAYLRANPNTPTPQELFAMRKYQGGGFLPINQVMWGSLQRMLSAAH